MNKITPKQFRFLDAARSTDPARPYLGFFHLGVGVAWTTDGHRLHLLGSPAEDTLRSYAATSAKRLTAKIQSDAPSELDLDLGYVPQYQKVIPSKVPKKYKIPVSLIFDIVNSASAITDSIAIRVLPGKVIIAAELGPFGVQRIAIDAPVDGEGETYQINTDYLVDAMSEHATIELPADYLCPIAIQGHVDRMRSLAVVMPMRLSPWTGALLKEEVVK